MPSNVVCYNWKVSIVKFGDAMWLSAPETPEYIIGPSGQRHVVTLRSEWAAWVSVWWELACPTPENTQVSARDEYLRNFCRIANKPYKKKNQCRASKLLMIA